MSVTAMQYSYYLSSIMGIGADDHFQELYIPSLNLAVNLYGGQINIIPTDKPRIKSGGVSIQIAPEFVKQAESDQDARVALNELLAEGKVDTLQTLTNRSISENLVQQLQSLWNLKRKTIAMERAMLGEVSKALMVNTYENMFD